MAKYVEFQRLRFEDRLRVEVTMPSDAADWPVPAFCLQTLVENAVRHAVEPDPVGGTIVIETAREGDRLRIAVRDSGSGATDAKTAGSGSGLASLRERLTTLYGDRASVESQSLVPSGFEVRLLLPALPAADIQGPAIV